MDVINTFFELGYGELVSSCMDVTNSFFELGYGELYDSLSKEVYRTYNLRLNFIISYELIIIVWISFQVQIM